MTREEHLKWAKDRALEYVDRGELQNALSSITSDLGKHPETQELVGVAFLGIASVGSEGQMRSFIAGFK